MLDMNGAFRTTTLPGLDEFINSWDIRESIFFKFEMNGGYWLIWTTEHDQPYKAQLFDNGDATLIQEHMDAEIYKSWEMSDSFTSKENAPAIIQLWHNRVFYWHDERTIIHQLDKRIRAECEVAGIDVNLITITKGLDQAEGVFYVMVLPKIDWENYKPETDEEQSD
jgi:hypothetical protein